VLLALLDKETMRKARILQFVTLSALSGCVGCGPSAPMQPSSPAPASSVLLITDFRVTGWHAGGRFYYTPTLVVAATEPVGVDIHEVLFSRSAIETGPGFRLTSFRPPTPARVPAGGLRDLVSPLFDFVTDAPLDRLYVRVSYVDHAGEARMAVGDIAAPALPREPPEESLAIRAFSVAGYTANQCSSYLPRLTLAETTGRGQVTIVRIQFELLGAPGGVPSNSSRILVPPGGTVVLDDDEYGPWAEISNCYPMVSRVSVAVLYLNDRGRGATVSAVTDVSR